MHISAFWLYRRLIGRIRVHVRHKWMINYALLTDDADNGATLCDWDLLLLGDKFPPLSSRFTDGDRKRFLYNYKFIPRKNHMACIHRLLYLNQYFTEVSNEIFYGCAKFVKRLPFNLFWYLVEQHKIEISEFTICVIINAYTKTQDPHILRVLRLVTSMRIDDYEKWRVLSHTALTSNLKAYKCASARLLDTDKHFDGLIISALHNIDTGTKKGHGLAILKYMLRGYTPRKESTAGFELFLFDSYTDDYDDHWDQLQINLQYLIDKQYISTENDQKFLHIYLDLHYSQNDGTTPMNYSPQFLQWIAQYLNDNGKKRVLDILIHNHDSVFAYKMTKYNITPRGKLLKHLFISSRKFSRDRKPIFLSRK